MSFINRFTTARVSDAYPLSHRVPSLEFPSFAEFAFCNVYISNTAKEKIMAGLSFCSLFFFSVFLSLLHFVLFLLYPSTIHALYHCTLLDLACLENI